MAIIDLYVSKVAVTGSRVEIAGLFKKVNIKISDIEKAKIEDHELFLYLKSGTVQKLPSWFGEKNSLQKVLANRMKSL